MILRKWFLRVPFNGFAEGVMGDIPDPLSRFALIQV